MRHNKTLTALLLGTALTLSAHASTDSFIITVKTDNTGTSSDTEFIIPVGSSGYDYTIDCDSDGTPEAENVTGEYTCSYGTAGTYTVSIDGIFPQIYFNNTGDKDKLLSVEQWGTTPWNTMYRAFYGCSNLVINASDTPNLTKVSTLGYMFTLALNIGNGTGNWNWDTSNIVSMDHMFSFARPFNKDISGWDVSSVTTMQFMFDNSAFNQDISGWDVSNVTDMSSMFSNNTSFNQDISNWDTSKVWDMRLMFYSADSFNQDLSRWDVSNVTTMFGMFNGATAFNHDIGDWNVSKVTNMSNMFYFADNFNQDFGDWDVSGVTNFANMMTGPTVSVSNYDALLETLNTHSAQEDVEFVADGGQYCEGAAARQSLIDDHGWIFIDNGMNCDYYIDAPRSMSVASGTAEVGSVSYVDLTSVGPDTFSITGGADGELFTIDAESGLLSFVSAPDAADPLDSNGDNVYRVQVKVTDGVNEDLQTIKVEVTDSGSATPNVTPLIMYLLN